MKEILIINGHDYSRFIKRKGYGWTRNDLDSEKTTRTKDGTMRRQKVTTKRKCSYELMNMTQADLARLDSDLSLETFSATYLDIHGVQTRTFYSSSLSATCVDCSGDSAEWDSASFSMTEV